MNNKWRIRRDLEGSDRPIIEVLYGVLPSERRKPRNPSVSIAGVLVGIRTGYLSDENLQSYHFTDLLHMHFI
jgi:hypothetical protein